MLNKWLKQTAMQNLAAQKLFLKYLSGKISIVYFNNKKKFK